MSKHTQFNYIINVDGSCLITPELNYDIIR